MIYIAGHKTDDLHYHENVTKPLFKELFNKNVNIGFRKKEHALFIRFSDQEIFAKLSKYLPIGRKYDFLKIPEDILSNQKYFFAFVRGLADTDGCVVFSKQHRTYPYYPRIEITSKSKIFLSKILLELKTVGFYGSVSHKGKDNYRLEIPGIKNLFKWLEFIGFSNITKINKIMDHFSGTSVVQKRPRSDSNRRSRG
ncbi:MAG: hypothetical protein KJ771_04460 [Nanoarchaeota archaeon]|nr:hypothetical protein [Nanoarchaeota archaeon]